MSHVIDCRWMVQIPLARVLAGAAPFKHGNVNDTYRGQVLLEDNSIRQAIIKDVAPVELCNELLAFCLARRLGLPVPDCFLGVAATDALNAAKGPLQADGSRLVFVSTDVKVPNITFRMQSSSPGSQAALMAEIIQWADLGRLYGFDSWIANVDRHAGNLLFGNPGEAWLIDHGHCFGGPTWAVADLDPSHEFNNRLGEWVTPHLSLDQKNARLSEACAVEAKLVGFDPKEATHSSRLEGLLPVDCLEALHEFLIGRRSRVTACASKALGIPVLT